MTIHEKLLELRQNEKQITSEILDVLQKMESQRGYLGLGYSSLFDYLVRGLGYSESTAYQRQSCLRLSRDIPEIKEKIDQGKLSFTAVTMAYKSIRNKPVAEKRRVLQSIENKSSREIKKILLEPAKPIQVKKTAYKDKVILRLELNHEQYEKLERLKALKSHSKNIESLLETMIEKELKQYEPREIRSCDQVKRNKKVSRGGISNSKNPHYIPKRLRNHALSKANYLCQFPGCKETHYLQIDHIVPVRLGGRASSENLQVLCGAHNRYKN